MPVCPFLLIVGLGKMLAAVFGGKGRSNHVICFHEHGHFLAFFFGGGGGLIYRPVLYFAG